MTVTIPSNPYNINSNLPFPTVTESDTGNLDCYCSSDDCQIDIDNDTISDCRNVDGQICNPIDLDIDGIADTCEGGVLGGVVGSCFCDDNCENCFDSFGNECEADAQDICLAELSGNG